jgi:hypothetical protein
MQRLAINKTAVLEAFWTSLKIALILVLITAIVWGIYAGKDGFTDKILTEYLKHRFKSDVNLEGTRINHRRIMIEQGQLTSSGFNLEFREAKFTFTWLPWVKKKSFKTLGFLDIKTADIKADNLITTGITMTHKSRQDYMLTIPYLKFKQYVLENLTVPLQLKPGKITFWEIQHPQFGNKSQLNGAIVFEPEQKISLKLVVDSVSLDLVTKYIYKKKDFSLSGKVKGDFLTLWQKGKLTYVKGKLKNRTGGKITIKKEIDWPVLKKNIDQQSYILLIDNFQNYHYNEGNLAIDTFGQSLRIKGNFGSSEMGQRTFLVNLYEILEGK